MNVTADELRVIIRSEFDQAIKDYDKLDKKVTEVNRRFEKQAATLRTVGTGMTRYLSLPIAAASGVMIKFAIDAQETHSKFETAFRGIESQSRATAESLKEDFGLSRMQAELLLASTGDLLKGFGASASTALELSKSVQELSVDLASYNNVQGGAQRASEILTKAMLGERDALTSLGIKISEEDVKARLFEQGQEKLTGRALLLAKAQATLELAYEQSGDALGDYSRTSDEAANKTRDLKADLSDLAVSTGTFLLPVFEDGVDLLSRLVDRLDQMPESSKKLLLVTGGITALAGPVARVASSTITIASKLRGLGPIMARIGPALLTPWGAVAGAIVAATVAIGGYIDAKRRAAQEYNEAFYSDQANQIQRIREQWLDLIEQYYTSDIDFDGSSIDRYLTRFNDELERAGLTARVTRDQVVQAIVDVARPDEFEEISSALGLTDQDLASIEDPTDWIEGVIDAAIARIQSELEGSAPELKTTWRDWWAEIVGADARQIAGLSGGQLASALMAEFVREIDAEQRSAQATTGELLDLSDEKDLLEDQVSEIQSILRDLFAIDPADIDDPFSVTDESVKTLLVYLQSVETRLARIDVIERGLIPTETQRLRIKEEAERLVEEEERALIDGLIPAVNDLAGAQEDVATVAERASQIVTEEFAAAFDGLLDVNNVARGVAGTIAEIAEAAARGGDALGDAGARIASFLSDMSKQIAVSAIAAGLRVIAETGAAGLPVGLFLLGLGGVAAVTSGVLASRIGNQGREYDYDTLVMDAEEDLADQRIQLLKDTIDEEQRLRRKAIQDLKAEFDLEFEVLRDLWERNIISTAEFESRATGLQSDLASGIDDLEQPTESETELATIQAAAAELEAAKTTKLATLGQQGRDLQHELDAMTGWQKLTTRRDENLRGQLDALDLRITAVNAAQTVEEVTAARFGADFVTSGPELLMVGDNPGGRERVSVEPLSSPNVLGPAGGVSFVITGNTFVGVGGVDELIEMIRERERSLDYRGRAV